MKQYRKKANQTITAVQLNLNTEGFSYEKWGSTQQCKQGDWLVNNNGECYTIDSSSFAQTYQQVSPGIYYKMGTVYAKAATKDGYVTTKEGRSNYRKGDYLVSNDVELTDMYCISKSKFEAMYELVGEG